MEEAVAEAKPPEYKILNQEERNDLRKRVLAGEELSLFEARSVYETVRLGGAAALMNTDGTKKSRKGGSKKKGMSDEEFNASLDDALKDV